MFTDKIDVTTQQLFQIICGCNYIINFCRHLDIYIDITTFMM